LSISVVPQPILVALDPAVRAIIKTRYNRTTDPSQRVQFALLPPPSALATDAQNVAAGFAQTAQEQPGAVLASLPSARMPVVRPSSSPDVGVAINTPHRIDHKLVEFVWAQTFSPVQQNFAPKQTIVRAPMQAR